MDLLILLLALAVVQLLVLVIVIIGVWKMFAKADEPGWASLVPIYNTIVLLRIVGRPWWHLFLLLIPILNLVIAIMVCLELARSFGKGGGFAVGLILLGFIFFPILGLGSAVYRGPGGRGGIKRSRETEEDDYDEDFDDDDRPRTSRKRVDDQFEDEEFDEPRPKAKKRPADDFDDEDFEEEKPRPREERVKGASRRAADEDEDFEEEPPPPVRKKEQVQAKPPAAAPAPAAAAGSAKVVQCSSCQKKLKVPATAVGKKVKCPGCGEAFVAK